MARLSQQQQAVRKTVTIAGSVVLATGIGLGLFLRPRPTAQDHLAAPASIPALARQAVRTKMAHHEVQMRTLVSRVVMLDDDGVARAAGEIFDEPALARPLAGDELNGLLPDRFFALQDELRSARAAWWSASTSRDRAAMADEFAALAKTCIAATRSIYMATRRPRGSDDDARRTHARSHHALMAAGIADARLKCRRVHMATMRAAVFGGKGKIGIREVPRPEPGPARRCVKVTLTTICGTDVHILKGEYPGRARA